ncbi:hypothetical protein [Sphingomonas sp. IW22]|uniref:hypothetical protein n=1 Tax=Sphingomonas sp. IW22 TaxID=3242489 RepID=UPI0035222908
MTVQHTKPGIEQARAEIVQAIEEAGLQHRDDSPEDPAKVIKAPDGLSVEVRYNGTTIPLAGNEINEMQRDAFQPFLKEQKLAVEQGRFDDVIERALASDGPEKTVVRVRALD